MPDILGALRLVAGILFVLWVPGLAWTFLFFPTIRSMSDGREAPGIDWIERGAIAVAISIAIVPVTIFFLGVLLKVPLTTLSATLIVLLLSAIPLAIVYIKRRGRNEQTKPQIEAASAAATAVAQPSHGNRGPG